MKKTLIILVVLLLSIVSLITINNSHKSNNRLNTNELPQTTITTGVNTNTNSLMKLYESSDKLYTFEYPENWILTQNTKYAVTLYKNFIKQPTQTSRFIQFLVIPKNIDIDKKQINNFDKSKVINPANAGYVKIQNNIDNGLNATLYNQTNKSDSTIPAEFLYVVEQKNHYFVINSFIEIQDFQRIANTVKLSDSETLLQTGTIKGRLCYQSQFLPSGIIEALNVESNELFSIDYIGSKNGGKSIYSINVTPGNYILKYRATISENKYTNGYYTDTCKSGTESTCASSYPRKNINVKVLPNEITDNINLCDFYYNQESEPKF